MPKLLTESTNEKWNRIKNSSFYKPMLDKAKKTAEDFLNIPTQSLKFCEFNLFYVTGNRYIYERNYFIRRGKLNYYTLMFLIYKDEKYLKELEDVIWAICDEFTWALPAHIPEGTPVENQKRWIDLFASETGYALSEIYYLIGSELSDLVQKRLVYEVRYRIISAYIDRVNNQWWETGTNNWAAVCAGSVGTAIMYLGTKEEFELTLPRILSTLDCFLSGFSPDGCCLEGYSYWKYGFGFYIQYTSLLRQYTGGEKDLFKIEKVKNIAQYQQKIILKENKSVSFSDGSMDFTHSIGITHFLYKEFDNIEIPDIKYTTIDDNCHRWGTFIRNFLWSDETLPECTLSNKSYYLEDACWYIKRMDSYAFAAKAGHNDEPHNHNDIGSFELLMDDDFVLCDFGCGEYVKDYFSANRYNFFVNSSRGHSLPIIDGNYQKEGKHFSGDVISHNDNIFEIEISGAYGLAGLKSVIRSFEFKDKSVLIIDKYKFSGTPKSVVERFVTLHNPVLNGNKVIINNKSIEYDNTNLYCQIKSEIYSDHNGMPVTAYIIDFTINNLSDEFDCTFVIG